METDYEQLLIHIATSPIEIAQKLSVRIPYNHFREICKIKSQPTFLLQSLKRNVCNDDYFWKQRAKHYFDIHHTDYDKLIIPRHVYRIMNIKIWEKFKYIYYITTRIVDLIENKPENITSNSTLNLIILKLSPKYLDILQKINSFELTQYNIILYTNFIKFILDSENQKPYGTASNIDLDYEYDSNRFSLKYKSDYAETEHNFEMNSNELEHILIPLLWTCDINIELIDNESDYTLWVKY